MDLGLFAMPALLAGMLALAVGGVPHCAAMCGVPCAAWLTRRPAAAGFLGARLLSYSAAGALLAAGMTQIEQAAASARALQPLWTLWHVLALGWGLAMLVRGRQPFLANTAVASTARVLVLVPGGRHAAAPVPMTRLATLAGLGWVAWPCGLLQSALLLASLGNGAAAGAGLMAVFALVSGFGLWLAPALWKRFGEQGQQRAVRLGGAMLVIAAGWALAERSGLVAWCLSPA